MAAGVFEEQGGTAGGLVELLVCRALRLEPKQRDSNAKDAQGARFNIIDLAASINGYFGAAGLCKGDFMTSVHGHSGRAGSFIRHRLDRLKA